MIDFPKFWQQRGALNIFLLPAAALYTAAAALHRRVHRAAPRADLPPIVVVGNVVTGGAGKTPVVIALASALAQRGMKPGVISRGVGGRESDCVQEVTAESDWRDCGDEALLMHRRTQLPVCVSRRRLDAAQHLAQKGCDIIISDDGLQHTALPRRVEICVTDATYRFGNGWHLPAGPLRESPTRAAQCDFHLLVGEGATTDEGNMLAVAKKIDRIYPLSSPDDTVDVGFFSGKQVTALAGIARPSSFFNGLEEMGIKLDKKIPLPDHTATPLDTIRSEVILMTEKDAVKYPAEDKRIYVVRVKCELPEAMVAAVAACGSNGQI